MNGGALIGRDAELARIEEVLDRARAGRGHCVFVLGEAGIGKTSVAREVLAHTRAAGCATLVGRCFEQHAGLPFFPFAELLTEAWQAAPASVCEETRERWPELGRIIPDLVPAPHLSGEDPQPRVRRSITGFLRAYAAARPLVLFLDDLHWADSASLDLVLYLGRHLHDAPVMLLGTYRDVDLGPHHPLEETRPSWL